ncbi:MAG: Fic family protein [Candidatus Limnocylindrales bacterium]
MSLLHTHIIPNSEVRDRLDRWDDAAREPARSPSSWHLAALWTAARSATVAASTAIEGNPLTDAEVQEALGVGTVGSGGAPVREILNYNEAMNIAARAANRPGFEWSEDIIQQINAAVTAGLDVDTHGAYRIEAVRAGIFQGPHHLVVPELMAQLVTWLREDGSSSLIRSALVHLNLIAIHPFADGNGRTARILSSLELMRAGVHAPELIAIETYVRDHRGEYIAALRTTLGESYSPEEHSATPWIDYYTRISLERLEARNRLMEAMPNDIGVVALELEEAGENLAWTPILLAARYAPIRTSAMARVFGIPAVTMRTQLAAMVAAGWLTARGRTRSRRYEPSARLVQLPLRSPDLMGALRTGGQLGLWAASPGAFADLAPDPQRPTGHSASLATSRSL